jgi:hypothetical protein
MKRLCVVWIAGLLLLTAACASKYRTVQVPPRVDLTQYQIIAVVGFDSSNDDDLAQLATRRFMDMARRDQGLVRMMNVTLDPAKRTPAGFRELGERHGARSILVGSIELSDIRPNVSISETLRSGSLTANVNAMLKVELIESATGASIWSSSARTTRTLGHISVFEGKNVTFDADDPDRAYGELVDTLVAQVTKDFRSTWVREPIVR